MDNFDKILVAIDNTDIDKELITAASLLSILSKSLEVHFIYVIKEMNMPAAVLKEFPNLITDSIKDRKKEIQRKVDQYFINENTEVKVTVTPGNVTKSILKYSAQNDIDLIIMGRKNEVRSGGISINRITRRAACSLLILPKGFNPEIKKLLVPIDFSPNALNAINQTINLVGKSSQNIKIVAQNVYQVPSGYHYTGKSYKNFAKILLDNIAKDYAKYSKKFVKSDIEVKPMYTLDRYDSVIDQVYSTAKKIKAGGIIISAKGRTSTAALFLGSKAEKMIQQDSEIPLMVIRPKGEQEGLIDYLREL